ncbi:MAG: hypothetical protein V2A67_02250 [Bacteroidota bacterium]
MKKLLVLLMVTGLSIPVFSQISPYLDFGKGGLLIAAGGEQTKGIKGCFGEIGGSVKGIVDLLVTVNADALNKEEAGLLNEDASSLAFDVTATWWLLRKQPMPILDVNVGVCTGMFYANYTNYEYMDGNEPNVHDYKGNIGGFVGFDSRLKIRMGNGWSFMPGYSAVYFLAQDKLIIANETFTPNVTGIQSIIGLSLSKRFDKGNTIYIAANQWMNSFDNPSYYDLSVGFIFAQK